MPFPKWGVITTSCVLEDMVIILKERGINDITIGEGTVTGKPKTGKLRRIFLIITRFSGREYRRNWPCVLIQIQPV